MTYATYLRLTLRNNNSIKLTTLEALVAEVQHLNPELIHLFKKLSQDAELSIGSNTKHVIPHIQSTIVQVRDALLLNKQHR
jgi:hypothetical protein